MKWSFVSWQLDGGLVKLVISFCLLLYSPLFGGVHLQTAPAQEQANELLLIAILTYCLSPTSIVWK